MTGLIWPLACRYATTAAPAEDLMQEGRIAVWMAEGRYRTERGCSFATFAKTAARMAMLKYLRDNAWIVRCSAWQWEHGTAQDITCSYHAMTERGRDRLTAGRDFAPLLIEMME
jgi:DNA-directed RNA polymerase specialized sigma subunit